MNAKTDILDKMAIAFIFIIMYRCYYFSINTIYLIDLLLGLFILLYILYNRDRMSSRCFYPIYISIIVTTVYSLLLGEQSPTRFISNVVQFCTLIALVMIFQVIAAKGVVEGALRTFLIMNLVYCAISLLNLDNVLYNSIEGTSSYRYIFGNKFETSYLFISLQCLFFQVFCEDRMKCIVVFTLMVILSIYVSTHLNCQTALIGSIVPMVMLILYVVLGNKIMNVTVACVVIGLCTLVPFILNIIFSNQTISDIIINIFHRDPTLSLRSNVYNKYLLAVINQHPVLGFGYSNNAMLEYSGWYYNAQNGLLDYIIKFGMFGAMTLIITIIKVLKQPVNNINNLGMWMLFYAMIVMGTIEVTYSWHMFLALVVLYFSKVSSYYASAK